jgi:HAD superfamily hydrolase (TIGR01509 family)
MHYDYLAGLEAFLADLHRAGVKTAVVTSSNQPKMQSVYRNHPEFQSLFDAILTSEDFAESKPSPDCYLRAAARLGATPAESIVFEDSINGLLSGRAAKMFVVGLTTTNSRERIKELSDYQMADYTDMNYKKLNELWQVI